jgi:hypothetical protein
MSRRENLAPFAFHSDLTMVRFNNMTQLRTNIVIVLLPKVGRWFQKNEISP